MDEVAAHADAKAIADMHPFAVLNGANQTPAWSDELRRATHHVPRQLLARGARELHQGPRAVPLRHRSDPRAGRRCSPPRSSPTCSKGKKAELRRRRGEEQEARVRRRRTTTRSTASRPRRSRTLKKSLTDGGVKIAADLPFLLDLAKAQENARTMIAKLKDAGVTTRHLHRRPAHPVVT